MRRYSKQTRELSIIIFLLLFVVTSVSANRNRAGEAVVKVKTGVSLVSIAEELQLSVFDSIPSQSTYLLKFSKNRSVDEVVAQLNSYEDVEAATTNTIIDLPEVFQISQGFPDESVPIFNKGLTPTDFYAQAGIYDIGIDSAQLLATGLGIVIAVIDNGIDYEHPLIQNSSILIGHDFVINGADASEQPGSIYGHGTFVTGLLLLTAPDVSILPLRAFDGDGIGDQFDVASSIDWAVNHGADIINMSFGSTEMSSVLQEAIDNAIHKNVVLIAASGNEGSTQPYYPAAHPNVIAVTSVDPSEMLAEFSNYGNYIDLVAPGVNMYSALAGDYDWGTWSGTSFSAPIVSGTVALMKQKNSAYTPLEIQNHLRNTSRVELLWGTITAPDAQYGYGMIDSYDAVAQLSLGDLDADGQRDVADLALMVNYIRNRNSYGYGGSIESKQAGYIVTDEIVDLNCDGNVNMSDVAVMVHHIFVKWREFKPCFLSK